LTLKALKVPGGVRWVSVNLPPQGNAVNATYDVDHPPTYLLGRLADQPWAVRAILGLAGLLQDRSAKPGLVRSHGR